MENILPFFCLAILYIFTEVNVMALMVFVVFGLLCVFVTLFDIFDGSGYLLLFLIPGEIKNVWSQYTFPILPSNNAMDKTWIKRISKTEIDNQCSKSCWRSQNNDLFPQPALSTATLLFRCFIIILSSMVGGGTESVRDCVWFKFRIFAACRILHTIAYVLPLPQVL